MLVMVISSTLESMVPGCSGPNGASTNGSSSVPDPETNSGSAEVFSGSGPSASMTSKRSRPSRSGIMSSKSKISKHGKHHIQLGPSSCKSRSPELKQI